MLSEKQVSDIMSKDIPKLLHARIDELEASLDGLISTANYMNGDSYAGAESMSWIGDDIAQSTRVLNRGISLDSSKEDEDGK